MLKTTALDKVGEVLVLCRLDEGREVLKAEALDGIGVLWMEGTPAEMEAVPRTSLGDDVESGFSLEVF